LLGGNGFADLCSGGLFSTNVDTEHNTLGCH